STMIPRSSDMRKMSNRESRRDSSRRRYSYTNTHNRRRNSSTPCHDNMERGSMSFRERDERSASPKATRCSSPNLKLRYAQASRCASRSASTNKNFSIASPNGDVTPFCAATPSSSTGRSIADAPEIDFTDRTQGSQVAPPVKPKDFRVPLTCFFWYHTGSCKKPDNKCFYAHYHTGTVAEPPISFGGKAMGGTRAKSMLGSINQREEELSIRSAEIHDGEQRILAAQADLEERLNAVAAREQRVQQREEAIQQHEQAIQQREQALQDHDQAITTREQTNHSREEAFAAFEEGMLRQLESNYTTIISTVAQMRRAVGNAQGILTNRRQQVRYHENFGNGVQGAHGQGRYGGSIAIDGAMGALGGLDQMLAQGEITLHAQIHNAIQRQ
ncbi:unnamed protein product, partial [Aureobasidium mustum]